MQGGKKKEIWVFRPTGNSFVDMNLHSSRVTSHVTVRSTTGYYYDDDSEAGAWGDWKHRNGFLCTNISQARLITSIYSESV